MSMTFPHQADFTGNMTEYNGSRGIPDSWYTTKQPASGNDPAETTYQCFMRKIVYRLRLVSASSKNRSNRAIHLISRCHRQ